MPKVRTSDGSLLADAGAGVVLICMPGFVGRRRVCAVRSCTNVLAISGAIFGELANIFSGVMLTES